jgi:ribosomal protein S18 acetylase RimI-like enzyme
MNEQFLDSTGAGITIRPYHDSDWPAICAVHDRARPDELRGSCDPRAFIPLAEDKEDLADVQRSNKFVACLGDQVIGFVGVDGDYLSWLYIDPAFSQRGIGRRLLRLGKRLTGPSGWTIALAGNVPALALYQSEGFQIARTFESQNKGYLCTGVRLTLAPPS